MSRSRIVFSLACLIAGVVCVWRGLSDTALDAERAEYRATRVSLSAPEVREQRIETIRVGQRVWVGENPSAERDYRLGGDIADPSEWRKMTLRCPKRDGTIAEVQMLRPSAWLTERDVRVGGRVDIEVPECGIDGLAQVLAIEPCPEIMPGRGRLVTATFHHQSARTFDLSIEGSSEPIGVTGNHPVWCEEAGDFVRADALRPGDHVRTTGGLARVASLSPRGPPESVYNLEVQLEHVYRVGQDGLLVHNACAKPQVSTVTTVRPTKGADGAQSAITKEVDATGKTLSKRHTVTDPDGNIIHQHTEHIGKDGSVRRFPDSWTGNDTIDGGEFTPNGPRFSPGS